MKRLGRWAFNILAGLSLLLCVATVVLWVRSHVVVDFVEVLGFDTYTMASVTPGRASVRLSLNYDFRHYSSQPPPRFLFVYHGRLTAGADWTAIPIPGGVARRAGAEAPRQIEESRPRP